MNGEEVYQWKESAKRNLAETGLHPHTILEKDRREGWCYICDNYSEIVEAIIGEGLV